MKGGHLCGSKSLWIYWPAQHDDDGENNHNPEINEMSDVKK